MWYNGKFKGLFENQCVLHQTNAFYSKILFYKWFFDDIFLIVDCTVDKWVSMSILSLAMNIWNLLWNTIRITSVSWIYRYTKMAQAWKLFFFCKSTDRNTILHGDSFHQKPKLVFKHAPNLRDHLVRSDTCPPLKSSRSMPDGNYKCGSCAQCSITRKCKSFNHPHTGKTFLSWCHHM